MTREPSLRRASTIGDDSSTRRPTGRDDAVDDVHQVRVVVEAHLGQLELAAALDVDLLRAVHEDVGYRRIGEQRLERAEAHHLVLDPARHELPLREAERRGFLEQQPGGDLADLVRARRSPRATPSSDRSSTFSRRS